MQNGNSSAFNSVVGVTEAAECFPYRFEQYGVIHLIVPQAYIVQNVRYRKNDMIMFDRQDFFLKSFYPFYLFIRLTFRAVSVATTVIAVIYRTAIIANLFVPAQRCRAAPDNI